MAAPTSAPRHTGLAILGIAAIPFLAVTTAAGLGDVASGTDPREALAGAAALLAGVLMGMLLRRMLRRLDAVVRDIARRVMLVVCQPGRRPASQTAPHALLIRLGLAPVVAFVPAEVGRRGPPVRVI